MSSKWEKFYYNVSLGKVPWQKTQADYLIKVIEKGKVKPGSALDLGCGTGEKSVYLAQKGFKVTGIDISKTAIKCSKENARKEKVKVKFITADATDLRFLKDKKFEFILDWANLHGIPKSKRKKYISEIIKHTKKGSKLLLRCFSKHEVNKEFGMSPMGKIYLFSKRDIENLYGKHFKIIETNRSKPVFGSPPGKWLDEYLMERT